MFYSWLIRNLRKKLTASAAKKNVLEQITLENERSICEPLRIKISLDDTVIIQQPIYMISRLLPFFRIDKPEVRWQQNSTSWLHIRPKDTCYP